MTDIHHSLSENSAGATESHPNIHRSLGRIEGQLKALVVQNTEMAQKVGQIDDRLRHVETRSAVHGAGAGFLSAVGVTMIAEYLRTRFGV